MWAATATIGSAVIGGVMQSKAASSAANAQTKSAKMGIDEQRRQFDAVQALLSPYATAGTQALQGQLDIAGLGTPEAQQAALQAIEQGPEFQALAQQGENAMLQNASATGGLRGGNTQGALAQFRPALLSGLINQQYGRLGGLTAIGQNAAAGVGNAGMQTGANVSNLMQQQGAAQAGGALASGQAWGNTLGSIGQYAGGVASGAFASPFGGGGGTDPAIANMMSGWGNGF